MIHHCSRAFAGASNDITVCHNDDPTTKYMENEYADEEFYILLVEERPKEREEEVATRRDYMNRICLR
jgi:hypothetical protein